MTESEQAQTVAAIKSRRVNRMNVAALSDGNTAESDLFASLEIVDSQAQKTAEQAAEIERLKQLIAGLHAHIAEEQSVK